MAVALWPVQADLPGLHAARAVRLSGAPLVPIAAAHRFGAVSLAIAP